MNPGLACITYTGLCWQILCVTDTLDLSHAVPKSHIGRMTILQRWMTKNGKRDDDVARAIKRDRSQISRIRRGVTGCSRGTAMKLQLLTSIRWHKFMEQD